MAGEAFFLFLFKILIVINISRERESLGMTNEGEQARVTTWEN